MAPSCATTDSVFPHKHHHTGPFKSRSTQHPLLYAGVTWCHNQAPRWVCSLSSPHISVFLLFFLTMDLSCPFLSLRFTSDPIFLPKPPSGPGQERTISQDVLPHFLYCVFCCPAGEFLKQLSAYHSVSRNMCGCVNLTTTVGHRIQAVDLICIYYVFEWKITVLGISVCTMYSSQHQHHQGQHVEDLNAA